MPIPRAPGRLRRLLSDVEQLFDLHQAGYRRLIDLLFSQPVNAPTLTSQVVVLAIVSALLALIPMPVLAIALHRQPGIWEGKINRERPNRVLSYWRQMRGLKGLLHGLFLLADSWASASAKFPSTKTGAGSETLLQRMRHHPGFAANFASHLARAAFEVVTVHPRQCTSVANAALDRAKAFASCGHRSDAHLLPARLTDSHHLCYVMGILRSRGCVAAIGTQARTVLVWIASVVNPKLLSTRLASGCVPTHLDKSTPIVRIGQIAKVTHNCVRAAAPVVG